MKPPIMPEQQQASTLVKLEIPTPKEDVASHSFRFKPSVGTWVMQPPVVIKQEQAYQYVPRHQAAASAYLEQLETSLKEPKTVAASEEIAQHYTPRFQAQAHVYLEKLEQSLRGTNKEEKVPTMTRDAPKVCLSSSVLYGPSFWSAGLR